MPRRIGIGQAPWIVSLRGFGNLILGLPLCLRLALCALWMVMIWMLSAQHRLLPEGADSLLWEFLSNLAHAPLFGLLAMWIAFCFLPRRSPGVLRDEVLPALNPRSLLVVSVIAVAYGFLDEWHQGWVAGRDSNAADVLVDALGVANVLWIASYLASKDALEKGLRRRLLSGVLICSLVNQFLLSVARGL